MAATERTTRTKKLSMESIGLVWEAVYEDPDNKLRVKGVEEDLGTLPEEKYERVRVGGERA